MGVGIPGFNNETAGISFEWAIIEAYNKAADPNGYCNIADLGYPDPADESQFDRIQEHIDDTNSRSDLIAIPEHYPFRSSIVLVKKLLEYGLVERFQTEGIPDITKACGAEGGAADFWCSDNCSLSAKTIYTPAGKVAPQNIGQMTPQSFYDHCAAGELPLLQEPHWNEKDFKEQSLIFKQYVYANIDELILDYIDNLFACNYLVLLCNVKNIMTRNENPIFKFALDVPDLEQIQNKWDPEAVTFTRRNIAVWNNSTTVRYTYDGIRYSIGEFQVHSKTHHTFVFRFNMRKFTEFLVAIAQ